LISQIVEKKPVIHDEEQTFTPKKMIVNELQIVNQEEEEEEEEMLWRAEKL